MSAADDRIVTDRPDIVESSDVVGKGRFQIEASVNYERNNNAGVKTRTFTTPTLFRLGVSEDVELRIESDGRVHEHTDVLGVSTTQRGWADTASGFKWRVQDDDVTTGKPGIALLVHTIWIPAAGNFVAVGYVRRHASFSNEICPTIGLSIKV